MQTLITVGIIVLVLALITALLIPLMKKMTQGAQLEYQLNRDGVTVQGHIISGYEEHIPASRYGSERTLFYLRYTYLHDGVSYEHQTLVPESNYRALHEGAEVSVLCLARHPKTARLQLEDMTQAAQLEYQLKRDGVTVQGHIISSHEEHVPASRYGSERTFFYLRYTYLHGGVSYEHQTLVPESNYRALHEGVEVSVLCLARHPKTARLLIPGRPDMIWME
ncbi:MAG: hypothetical protein ACJ8CB_27275 [Ktedonobacteraceae bacterium]